MTTLSYSEIHGQRKVATTHALARLNSYRNPLYPPVWATPPSPTPLSIAYKAMWDAEAKEREARTTYLRAIGTRQEYTLYGTWHDLTKVFEAAWQTYSAVLEQAHEEAEAAYEAALKAEQTAREIYTHEMLILVLPAIAPTKVNFKILGPRNKVPTDTWMDHGLYGVSELGLRADIRDVLQEECRKYLEADAAAAADASSDREGSGFLFKAVYLADARINAILVESPRVGLWKATKEASAGGAGAS